MSKRPPIDLAALTAETATPMQEAAQRAPTPAARAPVGGSDESSLNFKVSAAFRRRFKECAVGADLKLNELLVEALDAWERRHGR